MKKKHKTQYRQCYQCGECEYIGEGTFACMLCIPPVIVMENYIPTDDFGNCEKAIKRKNRMRKSKG